MLHDRMVFHPRFKSRMRNVSGRLPQPWSFQRSDDKGRPGWLFGRHETIKDQSVKVFAILEFIWSDR